jgi:hypothetical protein
MDVLNSQQAWDGLLAGARRGEWLPIAEVYAIVQRSVTLDADDERPISPTNSSPRWKRTVRNALQRRKVLGDIEWDRRGKYRLP